MPPIDARPTPTEGARDCAALSAGAPFEVGEWQVDPSTLELRRQHLVRRLEPKFMEVLCYLAGSPGRVISRRELIEAVWGDVFVTDAVLWRSISHLRKALEDDASSPSYLETVPRRGYRLIAEVRAPPLRPSSPWGRLRAWRGSRRVLATTVIASTLLALGIRLREVEEGPQAGDRSIGLPMRPMPAPPSLEPPEEPPLFEGASGADPVRAVTHLEETPRRQPDGASSQAALASAYATSWSRWSRVPGDRRWAQAAVERARRAVELAPSSPQALSALGRAQAANGHPGKALDAYRRAVELEPSAFPVVNRLALALRSVGELDEALAWHLRSLALDPRAHVAWTNLAGTLRRLGHGEASRRAAEVSLTLAPEPETYSVLIWIALAGGRDEAARDLARRALALDPLSPVALLDAALLERRAGNLEQAERHLRFGLGEAVSGSGKFYLVIPLAEILWASDRQGEAREYLDRTIQWAEEELAKDTDSPLPAEVLAEVFAITGQTGLSMVWLEVAIDRGFADLQRLDLLPVYTSLRADARFRERREDLQGQRTRLRRRTARTLVEIPWPEDPSG